MRVTVERVSRTQRKTQTEHAEEEQPEEHPLPVGIIRRYTLQCADIPSEMNQGKAEERRDQRADGRHLGHAHRNRRADQREEGQKEKRVDHKQTRQKEANQQQLEERQEWMERTDTREKGEPQGKT